MAWLHKGRNASVNERAKMNVTQVGTLLNSRVSASVVVAGVMVGLLTLAMISSVTMLNWRTAPRVAETTIRDQGEHAKLVDGRADGLDSVQMTFFGALWLMGIAQQYQLFNWIDHRNYATHYRVIVDGNEVDADKMFVRSLRGVLLDFYIHDITWLRVPPEHREELRRSILERTAARYCRNEHPTGEVEAHSSFETIDPNGGVGAFDNAMLMRFRCQGEQPIF